MDTISWGAAYGKGWNACRRAEQRDGADADMGKALDRFRQRVARERGEVVGITEVGRDAWITGWNDQAVGNDYQPTEH